MTNVVEFQRPRGSTGSASINAQPRPEAKPKASVPKLTKAMKRAEWNAALAAIWANPNNWRRSKQGNAYLMIDDLDICVVIPRHEEGGFQWEIRWRWGNEPTVSKWIYVAEQTAINEAWDAVCALA